MPITAKEFDKMKPVSTGTGDGGRISKYWPGKADERTEGMMVAGKYLGAITFTDKETGDKTTYYKLEDGEDIFGVRESAVIKNAFETINPGVKVAIRYNGKAKGKSGRMYNDFEVRCLPSFDEDKVAIEDNTNETIDLSEVPFD